MGFWASLPLAQFLRRTLNAPSKPPGSPTPGSAALTLSRLSPLAPSRVPVIPQGMHSADLAKPKYTGIMQTFWLVTKEEGPLALWKGNGANVLRVIPVYGACTSSAA